jgi:hypothetical protein
MVFRCQSAGPFSLSFALSTATSTQSILRYRLPAPLPTALSLRRLNDCGVRTARGEDWHDSTVRNLLARSRWARPVINCRDKIGYRGMLRIGIGVNHCRLHLVRWHLYPCVKVQPRERSRIGSRISHCWMSILPPRGINIYKLSGDGHLANGHAAEKHLDEATDKLFPAD